MYDQDFRLITKRLDKLTLSRQAKKTICGQMLAMNPEQRHEYFERILNNHAFKQSKTLNIKGAP